MWEWFTIVVNDGDLMEKPTISARTSPIDPLLPPKDAAKLLNVSTSWLAKARLSGIGPRYTKIGRSVRYPKDAVLDFIKSRMRGSTSEQ